MRLVIDSKVNGKLKRGIHAFLLFFAVFILFFIVLMPLADAESRGRYPTLRSKLYEQFRCGNSICDTEVMENERTCPIDCAENAGNMTTDGLNKSVVPEPQKKPTGLIPISTIVPSEEIYNNNDYPFPIGEKPAVAEAPSRVEMQAKSGMLGFAVILFLIFLLAVIILSYSLREQVPFFGKIMEKFFGITSMSPQENFKKEFEQEVPAVQSVSALPQSGKPKALLVIKKDRFTEGINALLSKLRRIRQIRLQKFQGMQKIFGKNKTSAGDAGDKNSSGIILARMVEAFKNKGMSVKEIQQRLRRMGLWSEETIRQTVKNYF